MGDAVAVRDRQGGISRPSARGFVPRLRRSRFVARVPPRARRPRRARGTARAAPASHPRSTTSRRTSESLPEVVHVATLLAVRDVRFGAGPRGDEDFQRWLAQLNRELLDQPESTEAMTVANPRRLRALVSQAVWIGVSTTGTPVGRRRALSEPRRRSPVVASRRSSFPRSRSSLAVAHSRCALAKQGAVQPNVALDDRGHRSARARTAFDATWA